MLAEFVPERIRPSMIQVVDDVFDLLRDLAVELETVRAEVEGLPRIECPLKGGNDGE